MKMTFLGTGGAFSRSKSNYHNNVLIETDDRKILIDCGTTALEALESLGVSPLDITDVIITHIHADHVGGLEELAFQCYFLGKAQTGNPIRPKLWVTEGILPSYYIDPISMNPKFDDHELIGLDLWVNCLSGGLTHIQDEEGKPVEATLETYFDLQLDVYPYSEGFEIDGVAFKFIRNKHVPLKPSFGLELLSESGHFIYFSADSIFMPELLDAKYDTIFHDCMFMPKYPSTVHTHFEELATLPEEMRQRIFLMHYGDATKAPDDLLGMRLAQRFETFLLP